MSFTAKLSDARAIVQERAGARGIPTGAGSYASVSAFNQNDEGIWRNGIGGLRQPSRADVVGPSGGLPQLFRLTRG